MRSSSVKTLVVTISMFTVVSTAAVTAEARPAPRTKATAPRKDDAALKRAVATMSELQKRVFRVIGYALSGPPLPAPTTSTTSTTLISPLSK